MSNKHGFGELLAAHLRAQDRSEAWLAQKLGVGRPTVNRWIHGHTRPRSLEQVERTGEVLCIADKEEREAFIRAAGFYYPAGGENPPPAAGGPVEAPGKAPEKAEEEESAATPASWQAATLARLGEAVRRATPAQARTAALLGLAWLGATWALGPMYSWPLGDAAAVGRVCLLFAAGSLALPALVGLATQPQRPAGAPVDFARRAVVRAQVFLGAYIGFSALAGAVWFGALALYYLGVGPLPGWLTAPAALLPVLFGYLGAVRTPADQWRLHGGRMRLAGIDVVVWAAALLSGPALAAVVYFGYGTLVQPLMGAVLLAAVALLSAWEAAALRRRAAV